MQIDVGNLTTGAYALVAIVAALIIGIIAYEVRRARRAREALEARELAVIEEEVRTTGVGVISLLLLVACTLGSASALIGATNVVQQIGAGVLLIAGAVLFGLGAALGRRRTYRIYRSENREP